MRAKTFGILKQRIATGHHPEAVGSAQIGALQAHRYGAELASRVVAKVSLGKRCILFRLGNDAGERAEAIAELAPMLKAAKNRAKNPIVPFSFAWARCIAAVAIDEMTVDMCPTCRGAREVPMVSDVEGKQPMTVCSTCSGSGVRRYGEDDRVLKLAREWLGVNQPDISDVTYVAKELRGSTRLHTLLFAVEYAKGLISEAERIAVEEAARMLERW